MEAVVTYLTSLQNKIFKILPMRESYDQGVDNHLYEYIDNLADNCAGALALYPELKETKTFLEVQANIAYIKTENVEFKKWRSIVLRSTRLIHSLIESLSSETSKEV